MAAILPKYRRHGARKGHMPISFKVEDRGRTYRVCATSYGRVLFVMLKHKHVEQPLSEGRRAAEIIRAAEKAHGITLRKS